MNIEPDYSKLFIREITFSDVEKYAKQKMNTEAVKKLIENFK